MKTIVLALMLLALVLLALVGCSDDSQTTDVPVPETVQIDGSKLTPACFIPYVANPIIAGGDHFADSTWNDPHVLKVGDDYIMYASSDVGFDGDIKIYRLISPDGIAWTRSPEAAVFSAGEVGSWDDKAVETPSVVLYADEYHLFYTGYRDTGNPTISEDYRVGHATSADGINWSRPSSSPLIVPSNVFLEFDQWVVAEPGAVVFDDKIHLYFSALGANINVGTTLQVIGLTIFDGNNWSTPATTLEPDQTVHPRGEENEGWIGYSTPSAIAINGVLHLFFDVARVDAEGWNQRRLHHAASSDGISAWSVDPTSIHAREDFTWTEKEIRSIVPFMDGNQLKIYYAGHKDLDLAIGLSTCDLSPD